MLSVTHDRDANLFLVEPSGAMTRDDFQSLSEQVDTAIAESDTAPGLVIHASGFPGWASFGAFLEHMTFVRDHHRLIPKIAFVSDATVLSIFPAIARHFVKARVRHFHEDQFAEAKQWATEPVPPSGEIRLLEGLPDHVVGCSVSGIVSAHDYETILLPVLEERTGRHSKINFLFHIGPDFESFSAGAIWDDARFGLTHLGQFSRIAFVSDVDWIRHASKAFSAFIAGEVQMFDGKDMETARSWVSAPID